MTTTRARGVSFAEVSELGRALPDVIESTSYGTPALKVKGKLLVRLNAAVRDALKQEEERTAAVPAAA